MALYADAERAAVRSGKLGELRLRTGEAVERGMALATGENLKRERS